MKLSGVSIQLSLKVYLVLRGVYVAKEQDNLSRKMITYWPIDMV